MSENPDANARSDFVGLMFNIIIFVLFASSLIAAWWIA